MNDHIIDYRKRKFIMISQQAVMRDKKLTKPSELTVYLALCGFADNETKQSYPSVAKLAEVALCSESSVQRALRTLEEVGYIEIRKRRDRRGFITSNQYVLLDVPEDLTVTVTEPNSHTDTSAQSQ